MVNQVLSRHMVGGWLDECPFCHEIMKPWSWMGTKDKAYQYTCKCNANSPSWYFNNDKTWSYINKKQKAWIRPKDVPRIFNPSRR
jgi:hypothetical protein